MALTPEQIAALRDACQQVSGPITEWLLRDAAQRIAGAGEMTSTAAYELYRANALGQSKRELKAFLKKQLGLSNSQINRLFRQAAKWSCGNDFDRLELGAHNWVSSEYEQMISAAVKLAKNDFTNLTQTLGMVAPNGQAMPLQRCYQQSMDFAFEQVFTGAADYETAIRQATAKMAKAGVRVIDYASGTHRSLEAAVRGSLMGGMGLMNEQITQKNHDDLGCDGWEISAHGGSAPDHEPYQGRQYSDKEYQKLNGSLKRRIGTLNCGHEAMPIILGVHEPQYTEAQLEELKRQNAEGVTYQGRHYTLYEAGQKQRQLERAQRVQKNRILVADATGDAQRKQTAQIRLNALQGEYQSFSKATGLRTQAERAKVAGFSWKDDNAAAKQGLPKKTVANTPEHDRILSKNVGSEDNALQKIAEIDIEKYSQISEKIRSSTVVLTDNQKEHIIRRRGQEFFDRYSQYFKEIAENPDFIFPDKAHPNTAIACKTIVCENANVHLVIRLAVEGDDPGLENSIITALLESDKRYAQRLRNNEPLYKRE